MGFESMILAKVADVLGKSTLACFTNGTLFILDIDSEQAETLRVHLQEMTSTYVDVSQYGHETAVDFC